LFSWGITRFSLVPIDHLYDSFERDIPAHFRNRIPGAIAFWKATTSSLTELVRLLRVPWLALICDYSDAEPPKNLESLIGKWPVQFDVTAPDKSALIILIRRPLTTRDI